MWYIKKERHLFETLVTNQATARANTYASAWAAECEQLQPVKHLNGLMIPQQGPGITWQCIATPTGGQIASRCHHSEALWGRAEVLSIDGTNPLTGNCTINAMRYT